VDLEEQRTALEQALDEGRVPILGERGKEAVSKAFVLRLAELPPTVRRLAIAKACTLPWVDRPGETPHCFRRDLTKAFGEAVEERPASDIAEILDELFEAHPAPVSEFFLRQISEMAPIRRYFSFVFVAQWESCPEWLKREWRYAREIIHEQYVHEEARRG
jgi:hypothetical protein